MKHIIWTNDLDFKDWKDDLREQYPDEEGYTDADRSDIMYKINDSYLDDERANMDLELPNVVVAFGDLGLWHGRCNGLKFLGTNLNSVFSYSCGAYLDWYVEDGDIKCDDTHHDGTNHYTYRVLNPDISKDEFIDLAYDMTAKVAFEKYTTQLGDYVKNIYGWSD